MSRAVSGQNAFAAYVALNVSNPSSDLPTLLPEIREAQEKDPEIIVQIKQAASTTGRPGRVEFTMLHGLLYRKSPVKDGGDKYQLVVPKNLVPSFLEYFRDNPLSGHLGRLKTLLGMDLMGPFPCSKKGNRFLLVIVDYFTKWVEMFPLRDSKAHHIITILKDEIFTCFGVPQKLVSDRGPSSLGIKWLTSVRPGE